MRQKKPIKIWNVDVDNIAQISSLVDTKNNSKYLLAYSDEL